MDNPVPDNPAPTAAILVIGNEILSGHTHDANLPWLAGRLNALGIQVVEARVVRDVTEEIVAAVDALRSRADHVFTTGGIGPTHDDITAAAIAQAFGVPLHRDPEAWRRLAAHYGGEAHINEARARMAAIPVGAALIDNPVSAAPGFRIGNVHVMAGVPAIMRAMFDGIAPSLAGGPPILSRSVGCHLPESAIAGALGRLQEANPTVEIGSYPFFRAGKAGTSLVVRGRDPARIDEAVTAIAAMVREHGDEPALA